MNNYFNYNYGENLNNNYNTMGLNQNNDNPSVGFERGNLFDNLYEPYKNYKPVDLNPKDQKEYLMYQVMMYAFALNDLNLYLDINPNDNNMINLRNKYLKEYQHVFNQYENKFGALGVNSNFLDKAPWGWVSSFPWEVDKNV